MSWLRLEGWWVSCIWLFHVDSLWQLHTSAAKLKKKGAVSNGLLTSRNSRHSWGIHCEWGFLYRMEVKGTSSIIIHKWGNVPAIRRSFFVLPAWGWPSRSLDWDMQDGPPENSWQLPNRNHCNVGKTIMNHPQFHHKYIGGTNHQNVEDLLNLLSFWPHYTWFSNGMATFTVGAFGMMNPNDCRHSPSMS